MIVKTQPKHSQTGFTIVELLIATIVFSVVLLVCAMGLIQITRTYYKGVTTTKTQEAARAILDEVAAAVMFSGAEPMARDVPPISAYCLGDTRLTFSRGVMKTDTNHVFIKDKVSPCNGPADLSAPPTGSSELLAPRMRLSNFSINKVAGTDRLYAITVRVVSGEDDLLDAPGDPTASCNSSIRAGGQFCAVSELTTTVQVRVK